MKVANVPLSVENPPPNPNGLAAGVGTVCAFQNGLPYCWGNNRWGQLGTQRSLANSRHPTRARRINAVPGILDAN